MCVRHRGLEKLETHSICNQDVGQHVVEDVRLPEQASRQDSARSCLIGKPLFVKKKVFFRKETPLWPALHACFRTFEMGWMTPVATYLYIYAPF